MKISFARLKWHTVCLCFLLGVCFVVGSVGQKPPIPTGPSYYLESWQGQANKPDQEDHGPVGTGTIIACIDVQPRQNGSECVIRYENGGTEHLKFHSSIQATKTDVVYLTCAAKTPQRSCKAQLTPPKEHNVSSDEIFSADGPRILNASRDANGNEHAASMAIVKIATVRCLSATGDTGSGVRPSCSINYGNPLYPPADEVGVQPPTVRLTCNGQGAGTCSARVTQ